MKLNWICCNVGFERLSVVGKKTSCRKNCIKTWIHYKRIYQKRHHYADTKTIYTHLIHKVFSDVSTMALIRTTHAQDIYLSHRSIRWKCSFRRKWTGRTIVGQSCIHTDSIAWGARHAIDGNAFPQCRATWPVKCVPIRDFVLLAPLHTCRRSYIKHSK